MGSMENNKKIRKVPEKSVSSKEKIRNTKLDESTGVCTSIRCTDDYIEDALLCNKCCRHVHYHCTHLPAYQISLFESTCYDQEYICINCVKVSRAITRALAKWEDKKNSELEESRLGKTELEDNIDEMEKELDELKSRLKCSAVIQETKQNEIARLQKEIIACESLLKNENEKKSDMQIEIDNLKSELLQMKDCNKQDDIDRKMKIFKENLDASLQSIYLSLESLTKVQENSFNKTYASITRQNVPQSRQDNDSVMYLSMKAKHAELIENHEKMKRSCNLIIFGLKETVKDKKTQGQNDLVFASNLCHNIENKQWKLKDVRRIGEKNGAQDRPLKVTFNSVEEKNTIMNNLKKLKDFPQYSKISINNDYTYNERMLIREWVSEAKRRNEADTRFTWKLRGTPGTRLELRKFRKRNEETRTLSAS